MCQTDCREKKNEYKSPKDKFTAYATTKDESSDSEDIFLVTNKIDTKIRNEHKNIDIIMDSGISKSVISEEELNNLSKSPNESERKMLESNQQRKMAKFRFGNGQPIAATKVIHLPIIWNGVRVTLKMKLLKQKVPTLLGMAAMKKMKAKINICDQTMEINGTTRKIETNDTGHIIWRNAQLDVSKLTEQKNKIEKIFATTDNSEI